MDQLDRVNSASKGTEKGLFLRFDGMYFHGDQDGDIHCYLRFYEDGTVISVSTEAEGSHNQIVNWFNKENAEDFRNFSHGAFETAGRSVQFSTKSLHGEVKYHGIIRPKLLHVTAESMINGNVSRREYELGRN